MLLTYRGVGNKHLMLGQPSGPESKAYDVTSGFFQLIIYKGSKRYFVTGNAKTLVADRMAPGTSSNSQRGLCYGARFDLPGTVKTRFP